MNIEAKIAELDAQIEDRTKIERELWTDSLAKEKIYQLSNRAWAEVRGEISDMVEKRKALVSIQKDCECVIPDEDIGRTVSFTGIDEHGNVTTVKSNAPSRVPIFDNEREFIEPK